MKLRLGATLVHNPRARLAKLVIGASALVALASSPPRGWAAQEQEQLHLVFGERNERTAILSIEVTGKLYAAAQGGILELVTTADRPASDLVLSARPLPLDAALPEPTDAVPEADATQTLVTSALMIPPQLSDPSMTWLAVPIQCAREEPPGRRPKSCVEQFEITLTRQSQEPLTVDLTALVQVVGPEGSEPFGTLQVFLIERAP